MADEVDDGVDEATDQDDAPAETGKLRYSDGDFLRIVADERRRSIGFGEGDTGELARVRIKAQEYRQGKINDLKVMKGRSSAVDTSLSDAVDTVMPDVMEVFFGGDDVVTFDADGADDEAKAREESDVLAQVVFGQNDAFRHFHDTIQDALLNRTGLFYWWYEDAKRTIGSHIADNGEQAAVISALVQEGKPWATPNMVARDDGSIELSFAELRGKVCFKSVPSEDFTVAADTVILRETAYCALRDRPRIQDLIKRGVDKKLARGLPHYTSKQDQMEQARDEAGENDRASENGMDDMRVVEVRTHYLRIDADDDGDIEIWRVETDSEETKLLQKEKVTQIPFGALTPYLSAHRFYGESLADKLFEVMRVKTVLLRMLLDSGYFALNQRYEVSEDGSNEFTIADLLNNAPNVPVRTKSGNAVRPLTAGGLGFDVMGALEFMSVVAEQRSGVVRNAQGLNPDTLHDTAKGVGLLVAAAQKRVRMICRVFAETGVKDLFLGIHQMLREQFTEQHAPLNKKVSSDWKQVRPDTWPERESLTVHVGVGSANREHDVAAQEKALDLTREVIQLQGGLQGPFVDPPNIYNRLKAFSRAIGEKSPEKYWTDPSVQKPGQAPGQVAGPPPNPAMIQAQNDAQIAQQKLAAETDAEKLRASNDLQLQQLRLQGEQTLQREKMQGELALERDKAQQAIQLQREEMNATMVLRRESMVMGQARQASVADTVDELPGGMG